METATLPTINPSYARTAIGAHVVGILKEPADQLARVTDALVDDSIRLADICVFGRRRALNVFDPEIDPAYRPQASRIVHLFEPRDRELRHYKRALEADEAIISVRVDTYERHRVAAIMKRHGVRDVAFYSRRHHRLPAEDLGTKGNAVLPKRWIR